MIEMGRIYGMTDGELFRRVIFPGALPSISSACAFALGIMWLTLIVAENHRGVLRPRLHGDAGPRIHADRRRGVVDPDLRPVGKARRQRLARAGTADAVLASGFPETLRTRMQEALRFLSPGAVRSIAPTFVETARLLRRSPEAQARGFR